MRISNSLKLAYQEGRAKPKPKKVVESELVVKTRKVRVGNGYSTDAIARVKAMWLDRLLSVDFSTLGIDGRRKRVIIEQSGKCNHCGIDEWRGESISLELEHRDGNHHNNARENLEAICPNCHSQTSTWRGRNKAAGCAGRKKIISDEALVKAYDECGNIRQCLILVGMAAKGSNYGRVKRALTLYGIKYNK
jgi:Zn finger protein HypA/HybF involved in hydrogenase expression